MVTLGKRGLACAAAAGALLFLGTSVASASAPANSTPAPIASTPKAPAAPSSAPAPAAPRAPSPSSGPAAQADEEASTRFKRGLQLFDEGDYTLALVEFERAYQLAPNYRALYNIALVNVQLGRYADASRTFERYLRDGGTAISEARRDEVSKTLQELTLRTATVEISTNLPTADVSLDGKPVDPARLRGPMLIDAGEHTLRATSPGYQSAYRTVTLAGADRVDVRLQLVAVPVRPEAPEERGRTLFWPGLVATGALGAGALATGAVMLAAGSRLNTLKNTPDSSPSQRASDASEVNDTGLAADILTGLTVAAGAVSLYLSLRVDHSLRPVTLAVSPQRLTLSGTF